MPSWALSRARARVDSPRRQNELLATAMPYCERKVGKFREWTEDHEQAEITLPLPPGTTKKELVCVINAESLLVRHVKSGKTLLKAEPLAGLAIPEESTWYVDGSTDRLVIVIAKAKQGANKTEQHWGCSLIAKEGLLECYMTPSEVKSERDAREAKEKQAEDDRVARVKASQRAMRAAEEAREAKEEARRARQARAQEWADAAERRTHAGDDAVHSTPPRHASGVIASFLLEGEYSWLWLGLVLCAGAILFEVGVVPLLQSML